MKQDNDGRPTTEWQPVGAPARLDETLQEGDTVRVARLVTPPRELGGERENGRPPRIGDIGTILRVLPRDRAGHHYVVEASDDEGAVVWLAELAGRELELADGLI